MKTPTYSSWASQVALVIKKLHANKGVKETQVQSLGWEDTLKEEMATHPSILAWRMPGTEEPGRLCVRWVTKSRT